MVDFRFFIHILVAALLGGVIGLERGYRAKEAGFRTHFLVALGAALFMVLSAYGFEGALVSENHRLDVSRIAAQVVSGIGFIGAGTIIFQRQMVHGLTTAAGLWVTAAIGMACGAGMYMLAAFTTLLVLIGLEALNWLLPRIGHRNITLTLSAEERAPLQAVLDKVRSDGVAIASFSLTQESARKGAPRYVMMMEIKTSRQKYSDSILHFMTGMEGVSVESIE
ncbi:MAG: MgtC/SapB family protein [Bacteroidaceae bacterium]|nr:MgtC/SapB family protein [Bacteroidaceae bacterium]